MSARKATSGTGQAKEPVPEQEESADMGTAHNEADVEPEIAADTDAGEERPDASTPPEIDEFSELQDRYVRLLAEFDNYKKRTAREWQARVQSATADLLLDLLDTVDNFERALAAEHEDDAYARGVQMIYDQVNVLLQRQGVSDIPALGESFDPTVHDALLHVESGDYDEGLVCQVIRRGYRLHDRVLRPAQVAVSRGTAPDGAGQDKDASPTA